MRYTQSEFDREKRWGRFVRGTRVYRLVWKFRSSTNTWTDYFVDGRYTTIEQELSSFKIAMSPLCEFLAEEGFYHQQFGVWRTP